MSSSVAGSVASSVAGSSDAGASSIAGSSAADASAAGSSAAGSSTAGSSAAGTSSTSGTTAAGVSCFGASSAPWFAFPEKSGVKADAFTGSTLLTWVPQNVQKRAPGFNFLPQFVQNAISYPPYILGSNPFVTVKTRSPSSPCFESPKG